MFFIDHNLFSKGLCDSSAKKHQIFLSWEYFVVLGAGILRDADILRGNTVCHNGFL